MSEVAEGELICGIGEHETLKQYGNVLFLRLGVDVYIVILFSFCIAKILNIIF